LTLNEITKQFIRENLNADVPTLALKKAPVGTDFSGTAFPCPSLHRAMFVGSQREI